MFFKEQIKKRIKNEKGLTLIELLAVIVILAIIAAIAIPAIGNIINNTRDKAVLSDVQAALAAAKIANADGSCEDNICSPGDYEFTSEKFDKVGDNLNITVSFGDNSANTIIEAVLKEDFKGKRIPDDLKELEEVKYTPGKAEPATLAKLEISESDLNKVLGGNEE